MLWLVAAQRDPRSPVSPARFISHHGSPSPPACPAPQVVDDSSGVRRHWLFFLQRKRKDGFEKDTATPTVAARELLGGDDVMTERDLALNLNQVRGCKCMPCRASRVAVGATVRRRCDGMRSSWEPVRLRLLEQ